MQNTLNLTQELINRQSVTPEDGGCQQLIAERLEKLGFKATHLRFEDVDNLWITHGTKGPLFAFAGHTDVVPTGPLEDWNTDPFKAEIIDGMLYGRGAADMKGGIAAMIVAAENFVQEHPDHDGIIAFLITSDEEGPSINGTVKVIEYLNENNIKIDWCVVGEPSSDKQLGDVIRIGRRGSLNGILTINGIQGHVAFPELAENPIHKASEFLAEISSIEWDQGNDSFPATSFQISNINAGTGAENVIPGSVKLLFNFRFSTELSEDDLKTKVTTLLDKHKLNYDLQWKLSGNPFLTSSGNLVAATCEAIKTICGIETECSTGGGTSDGRFIAPTGAEVIELGVSNDTIHKINECVNVDDLEKLSKIYKNILDRLLID
ncbi:MAG: succinyl-diaminopimelate desuccinylase [Proteobacteria bacterium]|nr:succinyl-diaminopimelate desuccinylase [Pseudomonadota bacterium]NOG59624.1 succinyl-diaminopimelate desuccinylase [Pseudomonadota bacterium]